MGKTLDRVNDYVGRVISGELPSCEMVRLAAQRWRDDWSRPDLYFDEEAVNVMRRLAGHLKHYKGELAGHYIRLEDWQLFIIANIFGWKLKSTQKRRFTYADVFVPRKNGKTTLAAIIALGLLLFDNEAGAEIYSAAVDKEQAKICFSAAKELLASSIFKTMAEPYKLSIVVPGTASVYKPLSKDTKNKDGLNPHGAVCDERHAWATNEIYEVLKTGMGARSQPLIFSISTAGTDTSLPYYADLQVLRDVMRGIKKKDNHFVLIYEPDEGDDWENEDIWRKVNPNYGISLSARYMREEYEDAKLKGGTTQAAFKTKNLNMWVDAPKVWIPDEDIVANNGDLSPDLLRGEECYVGIDLASKSDLTAAALYFPKYKAVRMLYTVPEEKMHELEDRVDYRLWHEQGYLSVTPGKILDEDWYVDYLLGELDAYDVKTIAYDPWGMWNILNKFGRYRDRLVAYQQSIRYMSVPTKELESLTLKHELNFLHNPILRWNFGNVVIYQDPNANVKIDKAKARNKVDGVVALVDALGGYLNSQTKDDGTIYQDHTLRIIPN